MTKFIKIGLIVALLAGGAWLVYALQSRADGPKPGRIRVSASFYPMAEFARQVGGDRVDVTTVARPGVEPHDFEPSPQDVAGVQRSRVFVYNGAGLEPWASRLAADLRSHGTTVVEAGAGLGDGDPHIWVDPVLAGREVDAIKAALITADPDGRATYEANAAAYKQQLAALNQAYADGLSRCRRHTVVTSHQALAYLASRYRFTATPVAGLSPNEEPSPQKLAGLADYIRANHVGYVLFETLASPRLAQTLAAETGAKTLVFNPIEGLTAAETAEQANYLTIQRHNLENLRIALDCI